MTTSFRFSGSMDHRRGLEFQGREKEDEDTGTNKINHTQIKGMHVLHADARSKPCSWGTSWYA